MQEELIKQLQAERDALAAKLSFLTEEHTRVTHQQQETSVQFENQDEAIEPKNLVTEGSHDLEQNSSQDFAQLQTNFTALQVSCPFKCNS